MYHENSDTHPYLKRMMSLPYLPYQHIPSVFNGLEAKTLTDQLAVLVSYFETTWIANDIYGEQRAGACIFRVYTWTMMLKAGIKDWTVEGIPKYLLLYEEDSYITNQLRLISDSKLKRTQKKIDQDMQAPIFKYWRNMNMEREMLQNFCEHAPTWCHRFNIIIQHDIWVIKRCVI